MSQNTAQKRTKRSFVWGFFEKINKGNSNVFRCKVAGCKTELSCSGNTTNRRYHLQSHHPVELREAQSGNRMSSDSSFNDDERDNAEGMHHQKQTSMRKYIKQSGISYNPASQKKKELDKALVRFIVKDIQPLAVVDDDGFAEFVHALDPRYCLPSRRHLRDVLLEQAYQKTVQHIGEILKPIKFIAITYDGWTSRTTQGYLVVTGHFIFEEKLSTATLGVIPIPSRSTSKNLKELIFSVLKRFPNVSVVCAVTDSGSNMISACDLMKMRHMPCAAHKIQRIVMVGISKTERSFSSKETEDFVEKIFCDDNDNVQNCDVSVYNVIVKCKRIATFFHHSSSANRSLEQELHNAKRQLTKISQPNNTRWNSVYYMLESIWKIGEALFAVLSKCGKWELDLTPAEKHLIPQILAILKPFVKATTKLSGDSYPTVNLIIPTTKQILTELNSLLSLSDNEVVEEETTVFEVSENNKDAKVVIDSQEAICFLKQLVSSTREKMLEYETRTASGFSTILDPRFKKHGFISESNYRMMAEKLKEELKTVMATQNRTHIECTSSIEPVPCVSKRAEYTFLNNITFTRHDRSIHSTAQAIVHLNKYLEDPITNETTDVLSFWTNYTACEALSAIALRFMIIPASSVPSERVNSTAEQLVLK
ncbi:E3 SUMO-protein ligase ZBED1-like isoform X3 [Wyeomyia smithii]|uniref:E3 SUMO-protein ligase ZBED1-like isoform X3 n=1 Tax=Wyeomyia smithii TaxID=174621 RepID=UPI002467B19B|nr:E3 SUMO-protein ligase ZBED1-like isoform X3 [Wyeomyia smithii]